MYNIAAYSVYLALVIFIVVFTGSYLFRNGRFFLEELFGKAEIVNAVNRFLYCGYVLINAGGAFHCLSEAETFDSFLPAFVYVAEQSGGLLIVLAIMHYINLIVIPILKKAFYKKQDSIIKISQP